MYSQGATLDVRRLAQLYLTDVYRVAKAPLTSFYENLVASLARMRADREAQLERSLLNKKPRRISFDPDQSWSLCHSPLLSSRLPEFATTLFQSANHHLPWCPSNVMAKADLTVAAK
ncbi:hypothetical protein DAPPUDRAFT_112614 [Daphnia pulex]|uniref:Uncharacterized protein n=1 Tax=Daphnia pulex TaxID=6669 RepID=E9HCN5_DAPPU|nr:hypothetical protein DAPPUDRAFT_112614 [Daphnia pulex]|eukprot:EFX70552.1 hypothetical protein DAPPUDRAFT_112614 [Daphnia pulex]